jgi:hypothetical protein
MFRVDAFCMMDCERKPRKASNTKTDMRRGLYEICIACVTVSKILVSFGVHLGGKTAAAPQSRHNVGAEGRRGARDLEG